MILEGLNFLLHLEVHLNELIRLWGFAVYIFLFLIIFIETGVVVMPFLPGDSLLFALGAIAAKGNLDFLLLAALLFGAAVLGDAVNYLMGFWFGDKIISKRKWISAAYLKKTHEFYEQHGGIAIFLARFVPVVRTLSPFLAGLGKMSYLQFSFFNFTGAAAWILSFLTLGYFFGNLPWVESNFSLLILGIVAFSVLPIVWEMIRSLLHKKSK